MKTMQRKDAVAAVKSRLQGMVSDDHCLCEVASRSQLFCHGFSQWSFEDLKRRYWWLSDPRPGISRAELERLANIWQVARQQVFGTELSCDTQTLEHDTCHGWDQWDNPTLARFVHELCGEDVEVLPDSVP